MRSKLPRGTHARTSFPAHPKSCVKLMKNRTPERWQSGRMRRFAKPLYGLIPVPRVRIPPSPPASLKCTETAPPLPSKYAKDAHFLQYFFCKPDCRERTAQLRRGSLCRLFSEGHMCSAVSRTALGECNAIRSPGTRHREFRFSPEGTRAVRFHREHWANAKRSEAEDSTIAS